jgi:DNA-binding NarL/FixJ family response regulator
MRNIEWVIDCRAIEDRRGAQRDRNAFDRHRGARRMVLVEPKALWRDWMDHILSSFVPDAIVDCVSEIDEIIGGRADLLVVGLDPRLEGQPMDLRATFATMRRLSEGAPIAVVLHSDDAALAKELVTLEVAGILQPAIPMEVAIAAIRLILAGGIFLPPQAFRRIEAADRQAVGPEALSHDLPAVPVHPVTATHNDVASESRASDNLLAADVLTRREQDVLKSLRPGQQNKIIAYELGISESTVKVHLHSIMKKLHASNRTQAALQINVQLPHFETPLRRAEPPLS